DIAKVAAAMNPAMSSWVALRRRVPIQPGQSVLVLGATGNGGAMAVQVALLTARSDRSREMNWIQIGSVAGPAMELPSVALRSANFRLQGSGQGSVSPRAYLAELPSLVAEITASTIAVTATTMPLADVEQIWPQAEPPASAPCWSRSTYDTLGFAQAPSPSRATGRSQRERDFRRLQ
ncbi:MAG TPA: hypothetical protein VE864_02955, partial [Streptosporangiaceae bacterium]|nr:hypothetical protein [Streptosporangiaceae bacterium]